MNIRGDAKTLGDVQELHEAASSFVEVLIEERDMLHERVEELEDELKAANATIESMKAVLAYMQGTDPGDGL